MEFSVTLPDWAQKEIQKLPHLETIEERMRAVIRFSRLNIEHDTGGPFAAGVFEEESGKLVSMGVNRVVPMSCSSAHAEVVALSWPRKRFSRLISARPICQSTSWSLTGDHVPCATAQPSGPGFARW